MQKRLLFAVFVFLLGTVYAEDFEQINDSCSCVNGSADGVVIEPVLFPESIIPENYSLVEAVRVAGCGNQKIFITRSISNSWKDIHILSCTGSICSSISRVVSDDDMLCGGKPLGEIVSAPLIESKESLSAEEMPEIVSARKQLSKEDKSISSGSYLAEFTGKLPDFAQLKMPDSAVQLFPNSCLRSSGAPIAVYVENPKQPMPVRLVMPFASIANADQSSYKIYGLAESWVELESNYSNGLIEANIDDISDFLKNNTAIFIVAGLACHALNQSCISMHQANNSEVNLLVHGVTSSIDTWRPLVEQAKLNKEPYDWVGFQYPHSFTTSDATKGMLDCLNTLGNYERINIIAHSVGGVISLKTLDLAYNEKEKYSFVYKVGKVIGLGVPTAGIDVSDVGLVASFLASHKSFARAFNRDSPIIKELIKGFELPAPVPPWAVFIAISGTNCDLTKLSFSSPTGASIKDVLLETDCLVSVQNAIQFVENPNLCTNIFTAKNILHWKLNDEASIRKLIMYLLNSEKIKAEPERNFDGVNQYVQWEDTCSEGRTYAIIAKKGTLKLPLFCNCGNGICEPDVGESNSNCPSDCRISFSVFCSLVPAISAILLAVIALLFGFYVYRKHFRKKESQLLRIALISLLIALFILLTLSIFTCKLLPLVSIILAFILTAALLAELFFERRHQ